MVRARISSCFARVGVGLRAQGKLHDEGRPAAGLAPDSNQAVVGAHDALGDMKPQTESGTTARTPIDPLEGVEDPLTMLGRDAAAVVFATSAIRPRS